MMLWGESNGHAFKCLSPDQCSGGAMKAEDSGDSSQSDPPISQRIGDLIE